MKDSLLKRKLLKVNDFLYWIREFIRLRLFYKENIMSIEKTIYYIDEKKCSIARFGDGEFNLILNNADIGFQKSTYDLSYSLEEVLKNQNNNLLICIPSTINTVRGMKKIAGEYWINWAIREQRRVVKLLRDNCGKSYYYGNALITRPYMDWKRSNIAQKSYPMLKRLWNNIKILIVEGEQTRLGVGNDLFENVISIKRILVPAKDAFKEIENIERCVSENYSGELILLACGPTATILAKYFADRNMRALDIGHLDIEYEWYLQKAKGKVPIVGKYVNEAKAQDNHVVKCNDEKYNTEIIERIGC